MIQIYKFGGSSLKNADGIRNMQQIAAEAEPSLVLVLSALGKTTNALEEVVHAYFEDGKSWRSRLSDVRTFHEDIAIDLIDDPDEFLDQVLRPSFDAVSRKLEGQPRGSFDFLYDQIVSMGEIWSTLLVHHYLTATGLDFRFVDIRRYLMTDGNYREGLVEWDTSGDLIRKGFVFKNRERYITQGFIAGTGEGHSTTLGREGSDYTAAILAHILDAQQVTIWKDVPGVMNADPQDYPQPKMISEISYREAIELAYFGAKVIHPKTVKPLHNKKIPLRVKSYLNPFAEGTLIHDVGRSPGSLPIFVRKRDQVLITVKPRDLSFVIDEGLGGIFSRIDRHKVKVNLIHNSAVSLSLCVDRFDGRVEGLIKDLSSDFGVLYNDKVELITIRHFTDASIQEMISGKNVLIEQKTRSTANYVVKTG